MIYFLKYYLVFYNTIIANDLQNCVAFIKFLKHFKTIDLITAHSTSINHSP